MEKALERYNMSLDALDCKILTLVQQNNSLAIEEMARVLGSSKSPIWTRLKRLREEGYIKAEVALLDSELMGLKETFFVAIRATTHSSEWTDKFTHIVSQMPEIMEAYRMAGDIDYLLKVRVKDTRAFDDFYKKLIKEIEIKDVTSMLSMEKMKESHILPL